jgi:8-oxo-dGTP diphosphatase
MKKNVVKVICAVIQMNDGILVVQRSASMRLPLKWEFPGGKLEKNETEEMCIKREIIEELNLEINVIKRLTPSHFQYSEASVELIPYLADYVSGEPLLKEHKCYLILNIGEFCNLDWAEADLPIVKELQQL